MAKETQVITASQMSGYLSNANIRGYLEGILNDRVGSFITSMASIANMNPNLQECTAKSLMMCGLKAAGMNLPFDQNLGYAYPVPYKNNSLGVIEAQFQMGYKGYVQLAMRSGQYKKLIVTDIRENELVENDPITETYRFKPIMDEVIRDKAKIVGYYAMFELLNGFRKEIYWPIEKVLAHGKRYSRNFSNASSKWKTDEDAMCKKTLLRQLISKWGPMSVEMQEAYKADMAVINLNEESGVEVIEYPDNPTSGQPEPPAQKSPLNVVDGEYTTVDESPKTEAPDDLVKDFEP